MIRDRIWVLPELVADQVASNEETAAASHARAVQLVGLREALPCAVCDDAGCEFCPAVMQ